MPRQEKQEYTHHMYISATAINQEKRRLALGMLTNRLIPETLFSIYEVEINKGQLDI